MIEKTEKQRVKELAEELTLSEVKSEIASIQNAIFGLDDVRIEMFPDRYIYEKIASRLKNYQRRLGLLRQVEARLKTIEQYKKKHPSLSEQAIISLIDFA